MKSIDNSFIKTSDSIYTHSEQQKWGLYGGILWLIVVLYLFIPGFINNTSTFDFAFGSFWFIIFFSMSILFILMGIVKTTTEINLKDKTIKLLYRNGFMKKSDRTFPFSLIQISSLRSGVSDANPMGSYMVKAGIWQEIKNGEPIDIAFFSEQVDTAEKRDEVMKELYYFFFPERKDTKNSTFLTNGDATYLLSDEEWLEVELRLKEERDMKAQRQKPENNQEKNQI
jgi:hypothetical protein